MTFNNFNLPPMPLPFLLLSLFILFLCTPFIYLVTIYLPELPIRTLKRMNYLPVDVRWR